MKYALALRVPNTPWTTCFVIPCASNLSSPFNKGKVLQLSAVIVSYRGVCCSLNLRVISGSSQKKKRKVLASDVGVEKLEIQHMLLC